MHEKLHKQLLDLEDKHNIRIVYLTLSGSKLYGTDNENSDTDYKFIFIPDKKDVLLKKDVEFLKIGEQTNEKNGKFDVDLDGMSVYKFMNLLKKSETGAIDILFSMFNKDNIIFEDETFTNEIRENYKKLLNHNMKAFVGYAVGQTRKFGIKGARYDELAKFVKYINSVPKHQEYTKLSDIFESLKEYIKIENTKYISFTTAPGARGNGGNNEIEYFTILGKMFEGNVSIEYAIERITRMFNEFGNRTKTIAKTKSKTDIKALSHSVRLAYELEELIKTEFIKFPLSNAEEIKAIKAGNCNIEEIMDNLRDSLGRVDSMLEVSKLPEKSDIEWMDNFILKSIE